MSGWRWGAVVVRLRLVGGFLLFMTLAATTTAVAADTCTLRVGWEEWPPYFIAHQAAGGKGLSGVDYDLMEEAAERAGCQLVWLQVPWARLMEEIKDGTFDAATSAAKSADREKFSRFSVAYMTTPTTLWFRKGEAAHFPLRSVKDLAGSKLVFGLARGTIFDGGVQELIEQGTIGAKPVYLANSEQAFPMLVAGRIDVFMEDHLSGMNLSRKLGIAERVEAHPLALTTEKSHYMFSRKSVPEAVVERFNQALTAMVAEKLPSAIVERYVVTGW